MIDIDAIRAKAADIPLTAIDSSVIQSAGYELGLLVIQFHTGSRRAYECSVEVYTQFVYAESAGKFFATDIKGKLSSVLLTGQCPDCQARHETIGALCSECGTGIVREEDRVHQERYESENKVKAELAVMQALTDAPKKQALSRKGKAR